MASCLLYKNIMSQVCSGAKMLSSSQPGNRAKKQCQSAEGQRPDTAPKVMSP